MLALGRLKDIKTSMIQRTSETDYIIRKSKLFHPSTSHRILSNEESTYSYNILSPRDNSRHDGVLRQNNRIVIVRDAVLKLFSWTISLGIVVTLYATDRPRAGLPLVSGVPSSVDCLSNEQILRELLSFHAASIAGYHAESCVQKPGDRLYRVELAVAV